MIQTTLVPGVPWPAYTAPAPKVLHRANSINPDMLVWHIKRGINTTQKLAKVTGFEHNSIRKHLYQLRKDGRIKGIPVPGKATLWRAL